MSQSDIVYLESYRGRRDSRFKRTLALYSGEPDQSRILFHLWRALSLVGGDRAAVVWLDEYGPGLAHPHILLDLGSDRPRRVFSPVPLRTAWDTGVPGLLDLSKGAGRGGGGGGSASIVALGSDGPRSWFLVVDSLTPRQALSKRQAGELMFLAGEISAMVLHQDLRGKRGRETGAGEGAGSFTGWPVLRDMEGLTGDAATNQRISGRFLVARLVRGLVEDDLTADAESLSHQVQGIRQELADSGADDQEGQTWARVLDAVEHGDHDRLLAVVLEWGRIVWRLGHLHGAQEILGLAYELAKATGGTLAAADAARFQGKLHRKKAEWDDAFYWYGVARKVAEESGSSRKLAVVLDGMANTYRDRGNLPRARELLMEVRDMGEKGGDRYALAISSHDLMTVEKLSGDLPEAIRHGWTAVKSYDSGDESLKALFDLAGVLRETGELSAARDAYAVVAAQVNGFEYYMLSLDALAYISALEGEEEKYEALRERMDAEGWERLSPVYRGQVLFYRGLCSLALGRGSEGEKWLKDALALSEKHGLNKLIFDIEGVLAGGHTPPPSLRTFSDQPEPVGQGIAGVRQGIQELREALAATAF